MLLKYLPQLEKEYAFWMDGADTFICIKPYTPPCCINAGWICIEPLLG
jgi:hypothetical protein